jgi:hypothetical protein
VVGGVAWDAPGVGGSVVGTELVLVDWATAAPPRKKSMAATMAPTEALARENVGAIPAQGVFIVSPSRGGPAGPGGVKGVLRRRPAGLGRRRAPCRGDSVEGREERRAPSTELR